VTDTRKAIGQVLTSAVPFFGMWYLMYRSLEVSYALTILLAFLTVGFLIRTFIIQHDCGHGSFTRSKRANDLIGSLFGILSLTPYHQWKKHHKIHHATASDLERRGTGDIWTMTVREYQQKTKWERFLYRLYRHPIVLFLIGPTIMITFLQRIPSGKYFSVWNKERASILWTNLAIVTLSALLIWAVGLEAFLRVQIPITILAATFGTWLFYIQHQFEHTYWSESDDWDYSLAALKGSSYYKLPRVLQWFTGNIGFHHIHHLSHLIPNYYLQRCHDEHPEFQKANVLTLWSSLRTITLTLWDEEQHKLVSFRQALPQA
jgi:omega-6 fatty acid desaturase (delta-12 desaturase)